ncbi:MAG: hypothetical protein WCD62_08920 [Pseudolabrys sp.]
MSQQRKILMHPFGLAVDVSNNNEHSLSGSYTLGLAHAARNGERFDNSSAPTPQKGIDHAVHWLPNGATTCHYVLRGAYILLSETSTAAKQHRRDERDATHKLKH